MIKLLHYSYFLSILSIEIEHYKYQFFIRNIIEILEETKNKMHMQEFNHVFKNQQLSELQESSPFVLSANHVFKNNGTAYTI